SRSTAPKPPGLGAGAARPLVPGPVASMVTDRRKASSSWGGPDAGDGAAWGNWMARAGLDSRDGFGVPARGTKRGASGRGAGAAGGAASSRTRARRVGLAG